MSETHIEALVQMMAPTPESVVAPTTRADQDRPAFGDHLRQLQPAFQAREPARQPSAVDDREEMKPPTSDSQATGVDDSHQVSPAASGNQPDQAGETVASNAQQESSDADSADNEDTDAAAETNHQNDETNDDDNAVDESGAAAVAQSLGVQARDEVDQQGPNADAGQSLAEDVDQMEPEGDVKRVPRGKAIGDARRVGAEPAPVATVDGRPANDAMATGNTAGEMTDELLPASDANRGDDAPLAETQEQAAAVKPATAEQRDAAGDTPHRLNALHANPDAPDEPEGEQQHINDQPRVAGRDSPKSDAGHVSTGQRADSADSGGQAQLDSRAMAAGAGSSNLASIASASTAEGSRQAPVRTSTTDEAGSRPTDQAEQGNGRVDGLLGSLGRFHRGSGVVGHGSRTGAGQEMPRVDAARFVGRVARAFETAQQRGGTLQLRLSPPELGSLRLELTVKQGVMTASLETETAAARQALLDHLPALRERLAEQNIRVERFDIDVRRDGNGGQSSMGPQQQPDDTASNGAAVRQPRVLTESLEEAPIVGPQTDGTGINLLA